MGKVIFFVCFLLVIWSTKALPQVTVTSTDSISCGVSCTNLTASVNAVTGIPVPLTTDDRYSGQIPIGFLFGFYDVNYLNLLIGSNGTISFDQGQFGGPVQSAITTTLASGTQRNVICAPWCDMNNTAGGSFTYATVGVAPSRRCIITFCAVPMTSCTAQYMTSQIILYERTNVIEVYVAHKDVCSTWNGGHAIIGIINTASGSSVPNANIVAPGRDYPAVYPCMDEAWRFTPNSAGGSFATATSYSVSPMPFTTVPVSAGPVYWYNANTGAYLGTGSSINVCPGTPTIYKAGVQGACADTSFGYYTITPGMSIPAITGIRYVCPGATTLLSDIIAGGSWSSSNSAVATVGASNGVVTGHTPGTTVITYSCSCGVTTTTVTVLTAPGPIITEAFIYYPCISRFSTLSNSAAQGTWSSNNTAVATVTSDGVLHEGATTGVATITYSNGCGMPATFTQTVYAPPSHVYGLPMTAGAIMYLCPSSSVTLSNDGVPLGTWTSSITSVATINAATGLLVSGSTLGTTQLTASNLCGGIGFTLDVTNPTPISGVKDLCRTTTTTLSNGIPYGTWSSSNTNIATIDPVTGVLQTVSATFVGTVLITYTMTGGCFTTATVSIGGFPAITPVTASVCIGSTAALSNAPAGGAWSSGNTAVATVTSTGVVTGIATGSSVITYATAPACLATATVDVGAGTFTPAPGVHICAGSSVTLSNASLAGTWSSGNTTVAVVSATGPGTAQVTGVSAGTAAVTYATGICTATITTVTISPLPSVLPAVANICIGSVITLSSAPAAGTWSSSNTFVATVTPGPAGGGTVTGTAVGTSYITYSLAGCQGTATINVIAAPAPITGPTHICVGSSMSLSDAATGGTWSTGTTAVATITAGTGIITGISGGVATVTYAMTGGCSVTGTVTVDPVPDAGVITGPVILCVGTTIELSNAVAGGTWSSSNTSGAFMPPESISGTAAGTDTILYIVNNGLCADTAQKILSVLSVPDAGQISGPGKLCSGSTVALSDAVGGGVWGSGSISIATVSGSGVVSGIAAGVAVISYTVSNQACASSDTMQVTVYDAPDPGTISGLPKVCSGAELTLSETMAGGVWHSSNVSVATIDSLSGSVQASGDGTVTITYTVSSGMGLCTAVASYLLTVSPPDFHIDSTVKPVSCYGDADGSISVIVTGGSSLAYLWSTMAVTPSMSGLGPGVYVLNVTEPATDCKVSDTFFISQPATLSVTTIATGDVCNSGKGSITAQADGGTPSYSYLWSTKNNGFELQDLHAGVYSLVVTDAHSCLETLTVTVTDSNCGGFVIHDVLTPNGDGVNDVWVIEGIQNYPNNTVQIFDKWGDLLFAQTKYNNDWDGMGKNGLLPDGTYYYLVRPNAKNAPGGEDHFTGSLLIKR